MESRHIDTNVLAHADGFFGETADATGLTTSARWSKKEHARFLLTFDTDLLTYLESLFRFRSTIGEFPTKTQQTNHPFDTDQKAAFWEAWVNHPAGDREGKVGLAAYTAYRQILDGRFLDPERSRARLEQLRKQAD